MKSQKMRRHAGTLTAMALLGAAAVCAEPVTLVDQNQRSIVLAKPAERVVTIPWPFAAMLMAVDGGSRRLIGMNPGSMTAIEEGILKKIFPAALLIRTDVVGDVFMPNVEALLEAGPDLVLQWGDRGRELVEPMTRVGIPVATLNSFNHGNMDNVYAILRLMDKALGRTTRLTR